MKHSGNCPFGQLICLLVAVNCLSAQSVQLAPILPSAAPGVATAPGTVTITGAQGQGKGTVTATLPASLPVINCPAPLTGKCLGPAKVTITHTLSGFGRFLITTTQDGVKLAQVGNTKIQQCPVPSTTASTFTCDFDYLPYIESGRPYTTRIRFDVLTTNNNFVDADYIVAFEWGPPTSCPAIALAAFAGSSSPRAEPTCQLPDLAIDHIEVVQSIQTSDQRVKLVQGRPAYLRVFVHSVGKDALPLEGVAGEAFVEGNQVYEVLIPGMQKVAPPGTADTRTRKNSLDFAIPANAMLNNQVRVTVRVWLRDTSLETIGESDTRNNEISATIAVSPNPSWPSTYSVGMAWVCLAGGETGTGEAACPQEGSANAVSSIYLQRFLPVKKVKVFPVYFPKVTLPRDFSDSEDTFLAAVAFLYMEYLKGRHITTISVLGGEIPFPLPRQPAADQVIFNVWGSESLQGKSKTDEYAGQPGGWANTWLVRSQNWYGYHADEQVVHGIGHNLGLPHYNTASTLERYQGVSVAPWDETAAQIHQDAWRQGGILSGDEFQPKFDKPVVSDGFVSKSMMDVNWVGGVWPSPGEFNYLFDKGPLSKTSSPPAAVAEFSGEVLVISGSVASGGATGTLDAGFRSTTTVAPAASDPTGSTCLRFFPAGASSDYCFNTKSRAGASKEYFAAAAPFPTGTARVALMRSGRELASLQAGAPPTVNLVSPAGGETWQGVQKIRWTSSGAAISTVQYSPDDGATWLPLSPTVKASEYEFNTTDIIGGEKVRFRVLASNGLDTAISTSSVIRVPQSQQTTVDVTEVSFPNTRLGDSSEAKVQVKNTGNGPVLAIATSPDSTVFTVDEPTGQILTPGDTFTLTVRFTPTASGAQQSVLRIDNKTVVLRGSGFATAVANLQAPARVDFGQIEVGKEKDTTFVLRNSGDAALTISLLNVSGAGYSIVSTKPASLAAGSFVELTLRLTNAALGTQAGQLTISSSDPVRPQVAVTIIAQGVGGPVPAALATRILNAASFAGGAVAPGEMITIFGSNIGPASLRPMEYDNGRVSTLLAEARVLFDGVAAPMIYTVAGQNSVIVPYAVAGKTTTSMVLEYQGRRSDPITLAVVPAAPGLFSSNSSGAGPGAILNFDNKVNTPQNPAAKGSIIVLYGTGEGVVDPPNQDGETVAGLHRSVLGPVKVTIGGVDARVLFAGSAPGVFAGLMQVNVEIPANAPSGNQPVIVSIGSITSQAGLTVAIEGVPSPTPTIDVTPATLDFGSVTAGQSSTRTVTVRNPGAAPLNITFLSSSNALFTPIDSFPPFTLQASESRVMTFRFSPASAGTQTGVITISSNDPVRPSVQVNVRGVGVAPAQTPTIVVEPTTIEFGSVNIGQTKDVSFVVRNTGAANLTVSATTSSNAQFGSAIGGASPNVIGSFNVGPGSNQTVAVRFTPTAAGAQTGVVTLTTNDPAKPSVTLNVTGTGASAGGGATGCPSSVNIARTGVASQSSTAFGGTANRGNDGILDEPGGYGIHTDLEPAPWWQVDFGAVRTVCEVRLYNRFAFEPIRTRSIRVLVSSNGVDFQAAYIHDGSVWGTTAAPLVITSQVVNRQARYLRVQLNEATYLNLREVEVYGSAASGGGGGATTPTIEATPASLDFGSVTVGQSATRTVTLKNTGTASLNITFLSSSNALFNPIDSFPPFTLQPGESRVVTIRFAPVSAGTASSVITIFSNDPVRPTLTINASATATVSGGGGTSAKVATTGALGIPNRTADNVPANAIDGNTSTFTWTTQSFNNAQPSYLAVGLAASASINRIRLFKDNDTGGTGLAAKNLVIEYTASDPSIPLGSRVWQPVTGLSNGFSGTELMTLSSINPSNGTVLGDNHNSQVSGWASLTFTNVNATGIRIGFTPVSTATINHYRVYEFEVYGSGGGAGTTSAITFGQTVNGALSSSTPRHASDCSNCYADVYQLTVSTARDIVVTLNSSVFDAYLNLLDLNGAILGSNDDGGGGVNARLMGIIQPGVYLIEVTSANDRETGAYTLTIAP